MKKVLIFLLCALIPSCSWPPPSQVAQPRQEKTRIVYTFPMRKTTDSDTLKNAAGVMTVLAAAIPTLVTGKAIIIPYVASVLGLTGAKYIERKSDIATITVELSSVDTAIIVFPPTGGAFVQINSKKEEAPPAQPVTDKDYYDWFLGNFNLAKTP